MNRKTTHTLAAVAACLLFLPPVGSLAAETKAPRPNFLVILADDLGFSDLGCYGSEIATPNLDRLAAHGLRFTQFYNTARCWPTRSALMTGYYPQQIHMDPPQGRLPPWTRTLPKRLGPLGYRSYHSGKWHVNGAPRPVADGRFDHSYDLEDHDRNFNPQRVFEDDRLLPPVPKDSGYYTTTAFADHAIHCLKEHAADYASQPFFTYLAFTVPHFPLHAPPADVARYRDRYLQGWDKLRQDRWQNLLKLGIVDCSLAPLEPSFTPRYFKPEVLQILGPGEIEHAVPWSQLTDEQRRYQATKMAIHAAMVDRMDQEIGRVLDQVRAMGAWDNTIIFFLSDNGTDATLLVRGDGHDPAAAPGSAASFLCLGPGWSSAGNSPFRRHKVWTHEGGISTPLIVHWPRGIPARGELRRDVGHVTDLVPTLLELAGAPSEPAADEPPLPGHSLVPAFAGDGNVAHDYLFFHHEGNRALRIGDYKLVSAREDNDRWELFNLKEDRSEQHDLAAAQPNRVREMTARWQQLQDQFTRDAGPVVPLPGAKKPARKKAQK
ncbi:MAG: arylsulfatase [Thermoguttaceae bacterium]